MDSKSILTQPLISISPNSIHILDIILPPLLIGLSLIIYDIQSHKSSTNSSNSSHVFINHTQHSRLLPSNSNYQFKYNLVQFGLDLDQLESGHLDVPYLFQFLNPNYRNKPNFFDPSSWLKLIQIFSISPKFYHSIDPQKQTPNEKNEASPPHSIKLLLFDQLKNLFGISDPQDQIGKVYLLSMPTYLGFTSINPLSIYFCYQKPVDSNLHQHAPLKYVVLDVQNTFSERHSYLLTVGLNESPDRPSGFHHEWTIPRAFHVSPFNDRSGFYKVSISDPFSSVEQNPTSSATKVKVNVKIVLLTSTGEKKFFASLHGTGAPFTKRELIRTWTNFPIILFLTTARILYQSFILHFGKPRLNVFPKPDPFFDLDHGLKGPNPPQSGAQIGGTGWQEPDWSSRWSKQIIIDYLNQRVNEIAQITAQSLPPSTQKSPDSKPEHKKELTSLGSFENIDDQVGENAHDESSSKNKEEENDQTSISSFKIINVILKPACQTEQIIKISPDLLKEGDSNLPAEDLIIHYSSSSFFSDLILFPTPSLAQLICDQSEASWKVSSIELFDRVFENPSVPQFDSFLSTRISDNGPSHIHSNLQLSLSSFLLRRILTFRSIYLDWQLSFISQDERNFDQLKTRCSWFPPPHFLSINEDSNEKNKIQNSNPIELNLKTILKLIKINCILFHLIFVEKIYFFLFFHLFHVRFVPLSPPWLKLKRAIFAKNHFLSRRFLDPNLAPLLDHCGSVRDLP